ncbi:hypothetical protein [Chitinophaga sancti]|uniref:Uncharacterized protein n=1 Tax=Chitinophaga sancti TaxID=1004 RepID=A0A1K1LQ05_9BACT|nr:hypothetical protein [Chitinophaga sancti]WQD64940.1 hypothetical protein U0033_11095 [Chitinophaga sancti]WQG89436.1 hypothetical protein SR876_31375 [Chitinophaga sancti]SFW12960.1 hypothetical protein SAMN05661012_00121 [Chitinophaga sancti]
MAIRERNKLKGWFQTGAYPTQDQFWDWLDSFMHKSEDTIGIENITGLRALLDNKTDFEAFNALYQQFQEVIGSMKKIWRLDVSTPLSDQYLNEQYPTATKGTQVICPLIAQGGEVYEKYNDTTHAWFRLYMIRPSFTGSPGAIAGIELDNYV